MITDLSHRPPALLTTVDTDWRLPAAPDASIDSTEFLTHAAHAARLLPVAVHDSLVDFCDEPDPSGALLIRGVPTGHVPASPVRPTAPTAKDRTSEFHLLTIGRRLGQPVGYLPEHGGELVQNIVPVSSTEQRQVSTSSKVELMFHTEAAFHPHRPRFLLLLCLRGDRDGVARTTLASIRVVAPLLDPSVLDVLFEPRFRTAVDESYLGGRPSGLGAPMAVLHGHRHSPHLVFDADLMVGIDVEADRALTALGEAVAAVHTGAVLEAGDLLIIDNSIAVHGRSPFRPRFDGLDRWLQRTFVVADLVPSAGERTGRIVSTIF